MPNKTLSFHDYVAIAKERMRGKTQEQVANMFNVSVSLIGKLEKHNTQYQEIQKHLQTSIIDETGRFIAQVEKPAADVKKFLDAQAKAIAHTRTEIRKPVEAVSKVIGQIESMRTEIRKPVEAVSKVIGQIESMRTEIQKPVEAVSKAIGQIESMRTEIRKPVEAVSKVIGQIESMRTEIRKPVEAVSKAIAQIESMRTEIQKPAADVKKFLDTQAKAITHMRTEIQKPVEAVSKAIAQIESMRTEIQKPAADVKKFLDTQAKAITHMRTEIQKPVEAVSKAIAQIESMGTESEIKALLLKLSDQICEEKTMLNFDMYNRSFQGFRIKGIDTTNLPSSTDNPGEYRLLLDPISGLGTAEEQEIWGSCFNTNKTVENWRRFGKSLPRLEYIPTDPMLIVSGYRGYIQASNTTPEFLNHYASHMKNIVQEVNEEAFQLIQGRTTIRNNINDINATHFQNN